MSRQWLRTINTAILVGAITFAVLNHLPFLYWTFIGILGIITFMLWSERKKPIKQEDSHGSVYLQQSSSEVERSESLPSTFFLAERGLTVILDLHSFTHIAHMLAPSTDIGIEPVIIPVTGHSVVAYVLSASNVECQILGFRANVIHKDEFQSDGLIVAAPPTPHTLTLSVDLEEPVRKAMDTFQPLEVPHFEILLDQQPPLIRPALKFDGQPARPTPELPFTLYPGQNHKFILSPITSSPLLIEWSLYLILAIQGERHEALYGNFTITGNTGHAIFIPHGQPTPAPASEITDHWDIQFSDKLVELKQYDQDISLDPQNPDAWYNKGNVLAELSRYEDALSAYEEVVTLDPQHVLAWNRRGIILGLLTRYEESLLANEQAIALDPQFAEAWLNRGNVLFAMTRYKDALIAINHSIALNPQIALAWRNKAIVLHALGKRREANVAEAEYVRLMVTIQQGVTAVIE